MKKHLLFVDDEPALRNIIAMSFEAAGYRVVTADCGFAALCHLIEPELPDAVIVGDLAPRPETSLTLVNDIRVAFVGTKIPLLMLSTQAQPNDRTMGLAAGADLYLTKPFSVSTLVGTVNEMIDKAA